VTRYSLDVSLDHFDLTRRQLDELVVRLREVERIAGRGSAEVATGWRGHAATQVCTEMEGLARVSARSADVLSDGLGAVTSFQSVAREAQHEVAVLNARAADPTYRDELAMLDRAFGDVRERVDERCGGCGGPWPGRSWHRWRRVLGRRCATGTRPRQLWRRCGRRR
jgi:hypothetical protein